MQKQINSDKFIQKQELRNKILRRTQQIDLNWNQFLLKWAAGNVTARKGMQSRLTNGMTRIVVVSRVIESKVKWKVNSLRKNQIN